MSEIEVERRKVAISHTTIPLFVITRLAAVMCSRYASLLSSLIIMGSLFVFSLRLSGNFTGLIYVGIIGV